jgi:hypothetical protein
VGTSHLVLTKGGSFFTMTGEIRASIINTRGNFSRISKIIDCDPVSLIHLRICYYQKISVMHGITILDKK